jgi:hypothetical protein
MRPGKSPPEYQRSSASAEALDVCSDEIVRFICSVELQVTLHNTSINRSVTLLGTLLNDADGLLQTAELQVGGCSPKAADP